MTEIEFIKKWNALTADNFHLEALAAMAEYLDFEKDAERLSCLITLHGIDGHACDNLHRYRSEIRKRLFEAARLIMGDRFALLD